MILLIPEACHRYDALQMKHVFSSIFCSFVSAHVLKVCVDNGHAYAGTQFSQEVSRRDYVFRHAIFLPFFSSIHGVIIDDVACTYRAIRVYTSVMGILVARCVMVGRPFK